jgi:alkylhydroperoxidase family enzyme
VVVPERLRRILDYALQLTRDSRGTGPQHIERLRSAGLTNNEIHRVCLVTSYFSFVNRVADGLGVELEPPNGER